MITDHKVIAMKIADLTPDPVNPRVIAPEALEGLRTSIETFGLVEPIVWNKRSGHIVGGHQRVKALQALGREETLVLQVDLDATHERLLNLTLNNPHIAGEFDGQALAQLKEAEEHAQFEGLRLNELQVELEAELKKLEADQSSDDGDSTAGDRESYAIVVECPTEDDRSRLMARFINDGLTCRAI